MTNEEFQVLILAEIKSLRQDMTERFDQVDQRFIQVDQRFDQVDQRFIQVDQRFDQVDQRFIQVDQRFDQVDQRFIQVDQRFDQVDQRLDSIDNRLSWLEKHEESDIIATLMVINNKVNDLHEMFRSVSEVLGDHELRIRALIRRPV